MTSLVERVARAIALETVTFGPDYTKRVAQAAIAAIPDAARITMLEDLLWRAMDDASLEPGAWYYEARAALQGESDDVKARSGS